ncbi:MAG: hypothetical protein WBD99_01420 [Thermodesulfobacteriota bacterium]
MRVLTIFSVFLLVLTLSLTISSASSAQTRSDYLGAYRDWILPTSNLGHGTATAQAKPRTDYDYGNSGSFYDFYLDWMLPRVKPKTPRTIPFLARLISRQRSDVDIATAQAQHIAAKAKPRTDYDYGNSGSFYDFYLDWMLPRVKPKTPRTIPFLARLMSRQRSDVHTEVYSQDNNK